MTRMTKARREDLAAYYGSHSTAEAMDDGEWVDEPAVEPMVTTSLRLPAELMQAVRDNRTTGSQEKGEQRGRQGRD